MLEDTIIAISTPPGFGGLGIVRISGRRALAVAGRIFEPKNRSAKPFPVRRPVFGTIRDPGSKASLDEAFLTYFKAPRSYTREDVVELSVHGSPAVLEAILELGTRTGARLAQPGEFTLRAHLNGRLDMHPGRGRQRSHPVRLPDPGPDLLPPARGKPVAADRPAPRQARRAPRPDRGRPGIPRGKAPDEPAADGRSLDFPGRRGRAARRELRGGPGHQRGCHAGHHRPDERREIDPVQRPSRGGPGHRHAFPGDDPGFPQGEGWSSTASSSTWSIWPAWAGPPTRSRRRGSPGAGRSPGKPTASSSSSTPPGRPIRRTRSC